MADFHTHPPEKLFTDSPFAGLHEEMPSSSDIYYLTKKKSGYISVIMSENGNYMAIEKMKGKFLEPASVDSLQKEIQSAMGPSTTPAETENAYLEATKEVLKKYGISLYSGKIDLENTQKIPEPKLEK